MTQKARARMENPNYGISFIFVSGQHNFFAAPNDRNSVGDKIQNRLLDEVRVADESQVGPLCSFKFNRHGLSYGAG
jgi:hypothetical protein